MKLGTKLSVTFFLVALAIVGIGIVVFMNSMSISESFSRLDEQSVPQIISLQRMQTDSAIVYSRAVEYTVEENEDELRDYKEEIQRARNDFDNAYQLFESASAADLLQDQQSIVSIRQEWIEFNSKTDVLLQLVDSNADEDTISEEREDLELLQERFASTVDKVLKNEQEQNTNLRVGVNETLNSSFLLIILGFAAAAIFAVVLGNIIARRISKPIINLRNALDDLAGGKYDTKIPPAPADEINDLVDRFGSVREQLKEKEKLQNEFLMIASHELRTPIQPILGYSELARRGAIATEKALDVITNEANRLRRLADDILDASKIEADKIRLDMEDINIVQLVKEIAEEAAVVSGRDNPAVTVKTALNVSDSLIIRGDRKRMSQALWNIINNALRFTSEGSITLSCAVVDGNYVELKVTDTGAGIPDEVLPNMFKKFVSKDIDGKAKQGTGLGLFISKGIIEAHNGKVSAARNSGKGSVVTIMLPMNTDKISAAAA